MDNLQEVFQRVMENAKKNHSSTEVNLPLNQSRDDDQGCGKCYKGYIIENGTAKPCQCLEVKRVEKMFKSSQITPAFRSKTFDNFTTEGKPQIIKDLSNCGFHYLRNFKKEDGQWLVALGQPGSGKTHISMAVSNELIKRFIPVLYFQHVEGMKELVSIISKNGDISEKKERMKTVDVLYWDDLFKPPKQPTAFDIETAFEVLNYRYLNLLPTIISSERTPEQLAMIDEATGSRIIERSRGHLVVLEGKGLNYRLEA